MDIKEEQAKAPPKVYTYLDLIKFENPERYSAFGKMKLSTRPSAPIFGFGSADRTKQAKVFQSKEMAKTEFIGKVSPGPQYHVAGMDKFTYKVAPTWKVGIRYAISQAPRPEHYHRKDVDFNPLESDLARRTKPPICRIGIEQRFPNDPKRHKGTPGPQYNPSLRHEVPKAPKFTFGFRRELQGFSPLILNCSTPTAVGPGSYLHKIIPNTSKIPDEPLWSFPKALRFTGLIKDKCHQTYDITRSIGPQYNSKKQSLPAYSFSKAYRDNKTGMFKDMMSNVPPKIRIEHPKI